MARTAEGAALTEAHRLAQVALSKRTVAEFVAVWRLLDPEALRDTFPAYFRAGKLIIDANRRRSGAVAAAYLTAFREAEQVPGAPVTPARVADLAEEAAMRSLMVTGPVTIARSVRLGRSLETAARQALSASSGAVTRHVLNGGREVIDATMRRDPEARGVARVTDGSPCHFCAMLASRGAVYSSATAAFRSHDRCGCNAEVVYGEDYQLPPKSRELAALWQRASYESKEGEEALVFRQMLEGRFTPA